MSTPSDPLTAPVSHDPDVLETWKEIAAYLRRDQRTVMRWERERGLPVHRLPGGLKSSIYARKSEIDAWMRGPGLKTVEQQPTAPGRTRLHSSGRYLIAVLAVVIAAGVSLVSGLRPSSRTLPRTTRLTSYPGVEWAPTFSPDGRQVAFSWNGPGQDNFDIYIKLVSGGNALRLTSDPAMDTAPVWSPDGTRLAFVRWHLGAPDYEYMVVPALGGAERVIARGSITPNVLAVPYPFHAWSPDGRNLILTDVLLSKEEPAHALVLAAIDSGETRVLTRPPPGAAGDCCPAVSPDGNFLAFLRNRSHRGTQLHVVRIRSNGETVVEPLAGAVPSCTNPVWSADSSEALCLGGDPLNRQLWAISPRTGQVTGSIALGFPGQHLSMSMGRLAYSSFEWESDIWQVRLDGGRKVERRIASTADDMAPDYSPDGSKVAFLSRRSGYLAVWIADADGSNALELVDAATPHAPRWSPDGRQIAYTCRSGSGPEQICLIPVTHGRPHHLTSDPFRHILPSWSRDGKSIYFTSDRGGSYEIWKEAINRSEPPQQVTRSGAYGGIESRDQQALFFVKEPLSGQVCRMPLDGGEETSEPDVRSLRLPLNFAVGDDGLYFAASFNPANQFEIRFRSFRTGKTEIVTPVARGIGNGMALSPDGRFLLFTTMELNSGDLFIVDGLR